ncbi:MAG: hypothetical protein HZB70_03995 [Candidatus Berkelbacteria bacterium]|nr:MAG: hypothetical protein HZB70_03995 [Candidatus Berkelbacteria bacterium]QQG51538.1 MAG: hypothetical protein HY845_03195 [Candidatus Berkelbacteria bacterium]
MFKTLFGLLLVALIFTSSLGFTVNKVKNPEFINHQVREVNLYGRLSANLPNILPDELFSSSPFAREDFADILTSAVDSQTFYAFTDKASVAYLNWLTGETTNLDFSYDLASFKVKAREKAVDRLLSKYDNLPTCNDKQIKAWGTTEGLPSCKLPSDNVRSNDIAGLLGNQVDTVLATLPNELSAKESPALVDVRQNVINVLRFVKLVWGITIAILLLYLVVWRRRAFLSLAFIFLLTGLIEAAFSLIAWDWVGRIVIDLLPSNSSPFLPLIVDVTTAVLEVLKRSLSSLSIVLLVIGAAFLLLWIFYRPRADHSSVVTTK